MMPHRPHNHLRILRHGLGLLVVASAVLLSTASEVAEDYDPQYAQFRHAFFVAPGTAPTFDYVGTHPPLADGDTTPTCTLSTSVQCAIADEDESIRLVEHALPPVDGISRTSIDNNVPANNERSASMRCNATACDIGIRVQVEREANATGEVRCEVSGSLDVHDVATDDPLTFELTDVEGQVITPNEGEL